MTENVLLYAEILKQQFDASGNPLISKHVAGFDEEAYAILEKERVIRRVVDGSAVQFLPDGYRAWLKRQLRRLQS